MKTPTDPSLSEPVTLLRCMADLRRQLATELRLRAEALEALAASADERADALLAGRADALGTSALALEARFACGHRDEVNARHRAEAHENDLHRVEVAHLNWRGNAAEDFLTSLGNAP